MLKNEKKRSLLNSVVYLKKEKNKEEEKRGPEVGKGKRMGLGGLRGEQCL